jgi:hypothetical protein
MTKKQEREHKLGNQIRKRLLQKQNCHRPNSPLNTTLFKSCQNGRYTAEAVQLVP